MSIELIKVFVWKIIFEGGRVCLMRSLAPCCTWTHRASLSCAEIRDLPHVWGNLVGSSEHPI
jgi:hypothetical protein